MTPLQRWTLAVALIVAALALLEIVLDWIATRRERPANHRDVQARCDELARNRKDAA